MTNTERSDRFFLLILFLQKCQQFLHSVLWVLKNIFYKNVSTNCRGGAFLIGCEEVASLLIYSVRSVCTAWRVSVGSWPPELLHVGSWLLLHPELLQVSSWTLLDPQLLPAVSRPLLGLQLLQVVCPPLEELQLLQADSRNLRYPDTGGLVHWKSFGI